MEHHNIAIIGHQFMGKAHMQAYHSVPLFFRLQKAPCLKVLCGLGGGLQAAASEFGFEECDPDYKNVVTRPDIDIVDICASDDAHRDIAVLAAQSGKHVFCEKPMARTLDEAREMYEAVAKSGAAHMVNFVYRAAPAVCLAKRIIDSGGIGQIYHFNCFYRQDFCLDKNFPFAWRMDAEKAGGALADKGSHMVDMGRYLVGEFGEVCARSKVYIPYRPLSGTEEMKRVTANDACVFLAEFENGATGCFEVSNICAGEKNALIFEVHGEKGSVKFNLERLNELQVYFAEEECRGYRTIMVTEKEHPYIDHWWPAGHVIGWQNLFTNQVYEFLSGIETGKEISPNFLDGLKCQEIMDALTRSDIEKKWTRVEGL